MSRRLQTIFALGILLAGGALFFSPVPLPDLFGGTQPGSTTPPSAAAARPAHPVVAEAPISVARIERYVALGRLRGGEVSPVIARSGGRVMQIAVAPGAMVAAGAPVVLLRDEDERRALEQAELDFAEAETALARAQTLAARGVGTEVQVIAARSALDRARLAREAALQALDRRILRAPIAGRVDLISVRPGDLLADDTQVTAIRAAAPPVVVFEVSERAALALAPGDTVHLHAVMLDAPPVAALVTALDGGIDPETGMMDAEAQLAADAPHLRPGMRVAVAIERRHEALPSVDPLAVQWSRAGAEVWVLRDGHALRLPVQILARQDDRLLVQADFAPGDLVAVEGIGRLRDGAPVEAVPPPVVAERAPVQVVQRQAQP
ncbi:MAG: efflux RND transporter periplasmic adaptor subunit [Gemmobacter sp.]